MEKLDRILKRTSDKTVAIAVSLTVPLLLVALALSPDRHAVAVICAFLAVTVPVLTYVLVLRFFEEERVYQENNS